MTANNLEERGISKKGHIKKILLKIEELKTTKREEKIQKKLYNTTTSKMKILLNNNKTFTQDDHFSYKKLSTFVQCYSS